MQDENEEDDDETFEPVMENFLEGFTDENYEHIDLLLNNLGTFKIKYSIFYKF